MNARRCHLVPVAVLAGLVSCGGDMEIAEEAIPDSSHDASVATTTTTTTTQEGCSGPEADCLDAVGVRASTEQVEPVARLTLESDYVEYSSGVQLFRSGVSVPAESFELDEFEAEVMMRVWVPCLIASSIHADPGRQEIRADSLNADTFGATLGIDFIARTRELASAARDLSGAEREAFFEEQVKDCIVNIVE